MPASMIRPEVGSRWKVSGSSIAMVAIGPMPGSTPINVPISAPASAKNRFAGVSATPNPTARLCRSSIRRSLPFRPDRDRQPQSKNEDAPREHDQHQRRHQRLERLQHAGGDRTNADQQQDRDHQPKPLDAEPENNQARRDEDDWPPGRKIVR